jgi:hypothetical protein
MIPDSNPSPHAGPKSRTLPTALIPQQVAIHGTDKLSPEGQGMNFISDRPVLNHPVLVLVLTFLALYLAALSGAFISKRRPALKEGEQESFNLVLTSTLTLLALLIGFRFSMAISRYDQRKIYEEDEANAIGTEYLRTDLLPPIAAENVRKLLITYLNQRILFYETRDGSQLQKIDAETTRLQTDLWSAVRVPAVNAPSPVMALAVSGMNDVLNSQGYTQAAWWNRIPRGAWGLMAVISILSNVLIGYGIHQKGSKNALLLILPLIFSISFFLISDIDSPRGGIIRVYPQNLVSLVQSLH